MQPKAVQKARWSLTEDGCNESAQNWLGKCCLIHAECLQDLEDAKAERRLPPQTPEAAARNTSLTPTAATRAVNEQSRHRSSTLPPQKSAPLSAVPDNELASNTPPPLSDTTSPAPMPTSAPASTTSLSVASPLAALGAQVHQHQDTETDSCVLMQLCSLIPRMGPPWW